MKHPITDTVKKAYDLAVTTREKAYAPYSKFKVGSAVKPTGSDTLFSGCNVENSSYPGTLCAERTSVVKMISELSENQIEFVVLVTDNDPTVFPCGFCLQVLSEFATTDTIVYASNLEGIHRSFLFSELLPNTFDKSQLPDAN